MTEENVSEFRQCDPGDDCGYNGHPDRELLLCIPGDENCKNAELLEAEASAFHTDELIKATKAINEILASIPKSQSCELSFLHLKQGTMLAWVEPGGTPIEGAITGNDDPDVVAKYLKLV